MSTRISARLSDVKIRNAKPADGPYKMSDGEGLHLAVHPTGAKCWRYRYRIDGRENLFAIGEYPIISLRDARTERDRARDLVKAGVHPAAQRRAQRLVVTKQSSDTFEAVAKEWIGERESDWTPYYLSQVKTVLATDVYPHVGKLPIKSVKAAHLLEILKRVQRRGAPTIAMLIRQWTSAIFRFAVVNLRADVDPAAALKGAVSKPKTKHKRALTDGELAGLLEKLDDTNSSPHIEIALRLLLITFVRPIELREATWSEFDLGRAVWSIPAERMKMDTPHIVPLSKQAIALLRRLKAIDGTRPQLFPNHRDPKRVMSPTTLNRCLERMGYAGYFSAHGFRATASTQLNALGWSKDAIERQLAHQERQKTRASYNHADYLIERVRMMQAWADHIDGLRHEDA